MECFLDFTGAFPPQDAENSQNPAVYQRGAIHRCKTNIFMRHRSAQKKHNNVEVSDKQGKTWVILELFVSPWHLNELQYKHQGLPVLLTALKGNKSLEQAKHIQFA